MVAHGRLLGQATVSTRRAATIDDFLDRVQDPPAVYVSPTGSRVALVADRALSDHHPVGVGRGSDVAVYLPAEHRTIPIADGHTSGISYGDGGVQWSPDGEMFAFREVTTEGETHILCWAADDGQIRRIPVAGVQWFSWISDTTLVVIGASTSDSVPPDLSAAQNRQDEQLAIRGWETQHAGTSASASVLDAGPGVPLALWPAAAFVVDARVGVSRKMAELRLGGAQPIPIAAAAAPNGRTLAFLTGAVAPVPSLAQRNDLFYGWPTRLGIVTLDHPAPVRWVQWDSSGFRDTTHDHWGNARIYERDHKLVWSPDASNIAVWEGGATANGLHIVRAEGGLHVSIVEAGLAIEDIRWPGASDLLIYGVRGAGRRGWYRVSRKESSRRVSVTEALGDAPGDLVTGLRSSVAYGVADGTLWMIDLATGRRRRLTDSSQSVRAIVCADATSRRDEASFILATRSRDDPHLTTVVVQSGDGEPVVRVSPFWRDSGMSQASLPHILGCGGGVDLVRYDSPGGSIRLVAHQSHGLIADTLVTLNSYLERIDGAHRFSIPYHDIEGTLQYAIVTLPVDYVPGRRYPMITILYPGDVFDASPETTTVKMDLWAAHGYVTLRPSMPLLGGIDEEGDQFLDVTRGVQGAVDRAIDLGYADPDRLGLWGYSMGGYAVYALLAQTHRFHAAITKAGVVDLVSTYGEMSTVYTYLSSPVTTHNMLWSEHGQAKLGGPPWRDLWRYWRNSPISYLDKIDTPLLIVQGDKDFVPIEQGEEAFVGLQRLGKRVEFARYWGEGHNFASPANIRDEWEREFAWFDRFLQLGHYHESH
jgi:dipeptidyl aminopeptidase/acylaminoacyl peptidase